MTAVEVSTTQATAAAAMTSLFVSPRAQAVSVTAVVVVSDVYVSIAHWAAAAAALTPASVAAVAQSMAEAAAATTAVMTVVTAEVLVVSKTQAWTTTEIAEIGACQAQMEPLARARPAVVAPAVVAVPMRRTQVVMAFMSAPSATAVVTPRTQVSTAVELLVGAFASEQKVHAEAAKKASAAPLDCWMQGAPARIASMAGAALVMLIA